MLSFSLLLYYWLDFLVGGWVVQRTVRLRRGLVIVERGWDDLLVDPKRYRLRVPAWLVSGLGKLLPRADVLLVLNVPGGLAAARKAELLPEEVERQLTEWRRRAAVGSGLVLDASKDAAAVSLQARRAIVELLERRAASRIGAGWAQVRAHGSRTWWVPRGPARVVVSALGIHQPATVRGVYAWRAARAIARLGGFRSTRRTAPPRFVREALGPFTPPYSTYAVARSTHAERYVALVVSADGEPLRFVKLAFSPEGRSALAREAAALERAGEALRGRLRAPGLISASDGIVVMETEPVVLGPVPTAVPIEVATSLGAFFAETGLCHGDLTASNLVRVSDGWLLVDWEAAAASDEPFADLFHFYLQGIAHTGRPTPGEFVAGVNGEGPLGEGFSAFASVAGLPLPSRAELVAYLNRTARWLGDYLLGERAEDVRIGAEAELAARVAVLGVLENGPQSTGR